MTLSPVPARTGALRSTWVPSPNWPRPFQPQQAAVLSVLTTPQLNAPDRKSTRLNSSHTVISYAVFCLKGLIEGTLQAGTSAVSDKLLDLVGLGGKSAADKGKDTRDYLAAAFPELNAWERAGADASSAGMVDAGFENQKELTKMQLDNQKEIAEMQNETQKEIAGIQSATSRQNTKDQVYAQNEML